MTRTTRPRALVLAASLALVGLLATAGACSGDDEPSGADDGSAAEAHDRIENELPGTFAQAFYDIPAARDHFLAEAEEFEPEEWEEVTADGDVTFEEFRSLHAVQNATNTYTSDFLSTLQEPEG